MAVDADSQAESRPRVLVLSGGPGSEREVSLAGGEQVAAALREGGYEVSEGEVGPNDWDRLDGFEAGGGGVVFPVLHGRWGEGGPLQQELERRGVAFVGSRSRAAAVCIDKAQTKRRLEAAGIATPPWSMVDPGDPRLPLRPPVVLKAPLEGSSIGLAICPDDRAAADARPRLHAEHGPLLVERFIPGREVTVGVLDTGPRGDEPQPLPPIHIVPNAVFYDYHAKYRSDETRYLFDFGNIDLLHRLRTIAAMTHHAVGARHLSRVDFIVDADDRPWVLEVNTLPGFTTHSLLPMAARRSGLSLPELCSRLVRAAWRDDTG